MMTLAALAECLNATLVGDGQVKIVRVADLREATALDLAVYLNPRWKAHVETTQAGALIVSPKHSGHCPPHIPRLVCEEPRLAWSKALRLFNPSSQKPPIAMGIHPTAIVSREAQIADTAAVGAYAVIEAGVKIGENSTISHHAYVGENTLIGIETTLMPFACILEKVTIGDQVWIGPHATIGSTGFGLDAAGRLPHSGTVHIGDSVSIGAHTCIDRGTVSSTRVESNTHIDNQVQVGHNVRIGSHVVICGQSGIAGGAVIEDHVILGGQVGISDHVTVGQGAHIAAQSGVTKNLVGGKRYSGYPAEPHLKRLQREARARKGTKA